MALIPHKAEKEALVELLESDDFADSMSLAGALLKRAFELIQQRDLHLVAVPDQDKICVFGPYASPGDAARAGKNGPYGEFVVRPLFGTRFLASDAVQVDKTVCTACKHPKGAHEHPKQAGRCKAGHGPSKTIQPCTCANYV